MHELQTVFYLLKTVGRQTSAFIFLLLSKRIVSNLHKILNFTIEKDYLPNAQKILRVFLVDKIFLIKRSEARPERGVAMALVRNGAAAKKPICVGKANIIISVILFKKVIPLVDVCSNRVYSKALLKIFVYEL